MLCDWEQTQLWSNPSLIPRLFCLGFDSYFIGVLFVILLEYAMYVFFQFVCYLSATYKFPDSQTYFGPSDHIKSIDSPQTVFFFFNLFFKMTITQTLFKHVSLTFRLSLTGTAISTGTCIDPSTCHCTCSFKNVCVSICEQYFGTMHVHRWNI